MEITVFPVTPFYTNCYVVKDGNDAIVIDPGEVTAELKRYLAGCNVSTILNTHCHCDHSGGNAEIVALTGAPLICHKADLPLLNSLSEQGRMFGVYFPPSPEPDRFIDHGDTVTVGSTKFQVRHTPGHSPGHVVFITDGLALVGDVLFSGSVGRTDLPGGSMNQLLESIREQLFDLPDDTVVYSGHGPETTIGKERRSNPFLVD
ncbi:MAG: putative metallo-hydrolase [Candidatus Hydrogenedentes bacterium ADurb.Bin179]|nr:MAG: putative metallo-hydrolase [Candidatus Hydrogenedentes bacterium ADurb.Bin179]